ncbi:hypothetical protein OC861_006799, partial [Tilletia horrida]
VFSTPLGSFTLNPGPFNIKEHTMITVMANLTAGGAFATEVLAVQHFHYGQRWGAGYQILIVMSTQLIGFSYAGFCRRWLVWPAAMIWPADLVQTALLSTLHHKQRAESGRMRREKFFLIAFIGAWCCYRFLGYIFTALSNQFFGVTSGLGMGVLTFDWSQISFNGSLLVNPWFTDAQNLLSLVFFFFWFLTPILYYANYKYGAYLPMLNYHVFERFGERYAVKALLTPDGTFDATAYNGYSQQYLPIPFMLAYGLSFATVTAILVHVFLYFRHDIVRQIKSSLQERARYPRASRGSLQGGSQLVSRWYLAVFLVSVAMGFAATLAWPTHHPAWALFLALVIAAVYTLLIGVIQAITNQQVGLNVITRFNIGDMLPARTSRRHDDLQDLRLHYHGSGSHLRLRSQARPLPSLLLHSVRRNSVGCHSPSSFP